MGIPAIEITKDGTTDISSYLSDENEYPDSGRRRSSSVHQQQLQQHQQQQHQQQQQQQHNQQSQHVQNQNSPIHQHQQGYQQNKTPRNHSERGRPPNPPNPSLNQNQQNQQQYNYGPNGPINQQQQPVLQQQNQQQQNQQQQPLNQQQQGQQQQQQQQLPQQQQMRNINQRGPNQRGPQPQQQQQKKARFYLALFDYDPSTMSPNPDGCEEELPFQEGDTIKVYGDKDPDGFYWGELRGRRGYVPHNMVSEIEEGQIGAQGGVVAGPSGMHMQSVRGVSRDRWGDIYANMPVKRMIALYDYDPQELSPNVDAEQVELSFKTGEVILVYGEMDEDGFFMGELDGVRGLVPSNFLTEAPEQYNNQSGGPVGMNSAQRNVAGRGRGGPGPGPGPGAFGPPPPPRDNMGPGGMNQVNQMNNQMNQRGGGPLRKDARPTSPTLLDNTGHPAPDHQTQGMQGKGGMIGQGIGGNMSNNMQQQQHNNMQQQQHNNMQQQQHNNNMQQQQQQQQQQQPSTTANSSGVFSTASTLFSGATNATGGLFSGNRQPPKGPQVLPQPGITQQQNMNQQHPQQQQQQHPQQQQNMNQQSHGGGSLFGFGGQQHQQQQQPQQNMHQQNMQQQNMQQGPNLMQKLGDIPGSDMLSKGKELIFMKFGLGGK